MIDREFPIVYNARHTVKCRDCDFAVDSNATTLLGAMDEVRARHDANHHLTTRAVDYTAHPLFQGAAGTEIRKEKGIVQA